MRKFSTYTSSATFTSLKNRRKPHIREIYELSGLELMIYGSIIQYFRNL